MLDTSGLKPSPERDRALPDAVRRHLGALLRSTYEETDLGAPKCFVALLARLDAVLTRAGQQDEDHFRSGMMEVVPALRRFARSLTHDSSAADDLVQDTLLRAWRGRAGFRSGTNLEAWLFTILRNVFYSAHRKQGREISDSDGACAGRLATLPEQGGHLDVQDVRVALGRLAPAMREALVLVAVEDLSYEEAAAVMRCRIGTVKSRVWRAREQLTRMLGYTGAEIGGDGIALSVMTSVP